MPDQFSERLELLASPDNRNILKFIQRGIEKESLRISPEGHLAQTPHPHALGSALTHPYITTDFSESLLEFITPVSTRIEDSLACLDDIHRYVYANLDDEQLWTASMPCVLAGEENIPLAQYGTSNVAKMKTTYRSGLGFRYGRVMQTIAGIHYNFSIPEALWSALQQQDMDSRPQQDYITESYFKLIRNFRRYSWLLIYLYGASPAVCKSFLKGRPHQLQEFDEGTLYLPYATALRMGDLGYQSSAQENLKICYNSLLSYTETLRQAIRCPHPEYEKIGVRVDGVYRQLSTALLQIENEFYSPIRPKRVTDSGEVPLHALRQRGIEYIEVRCIDLNPYLPLGIDEDQIRFLDCFLLYCLFKRSPFCDDDDRARINDNLKQVVNSGRDPNLVLRNYPGPTTVPEWGGRILQGMTAIADYLDQCHGGQDYSRVCQQALEKLENPDLTPSAQLLADMRAQEKPFYRLARDLAQQHTDYFLKRPLDAERLQHFRAESALSLDSQRDIEAGDTLGFDDYLNAYYQQYDALL